MVISDFETTFGSYSPYLLRLSVKRLFDDMKSGVRKPEVFLPKEQPTLFHEFTHHLQNISSIAGISHLDCLIAIWHNARNVMRTPGDKKSREQMKAAVANIENYRPQGRQYLFVDPLRIIEIDDFDVSSSERGPVKMKVMRGEVSFELNFGIDAFFESCSYLLERSFRIRAGLGDTSEITKSVPYKLGQFIGDFYAPSCSETRLLLLSLTAMQHAAPHKAFLDLIKKVASSKISDDDLRSRLAENVADLIKLNQNWLRNVESQIQEGFPLKDPLLGDVIKEIFVLARDSLNDRIKNPFPELDFLSKVREESAYEDLTSFIKASGGCMVFRDMGEVCDDDGSYVKEKDSCIVIGDECSIFRRRDAWDVFQTSIHYSLACEGGIVISTQLNSTDSEGSRCCPLFAYCGHVNRQRTDSKCQSAPWRHEHIRYAGSRCSYQKAVYIADLKNRLEH